MVRARREFLASLKALLQQRRALGDIICDSITKDCDSNPAVSTQHSKVWAIDASQWRLPASQQSGQTSGMRLGCEHMTRRLDLKLCRITWSWGQATGMQIRP